MVTSMELDLVFDGHALTDPASRDSARLDDLLEFWPFDFVRLPGQRIRRRDRVDTRRRIMSKAGRLAVLDPDRYRVTIPVRVTLSE